MFKCKICDENAYEYRIIHTKYATMACWLCYYCWYDLCYNSDKLYKNMIRVLEHESGSPKLINGFYELLISWHMSRFYNTLYKNIRSICSAFDVVCEYLAKHEECKSENIVCYYNVINYCSMDVLDHLYSVPVLNKVISILQGPYDWQCGNNIFDKIKNMQHVRLVFQHIICKIHEFKNLKRDNLTIKYEEDEKTS
jgi:hypothetical protein